MPCITCGNHTDFTFVTRDYVQYDFCAICAASWLAHEPAPSTETWMKWVQASLLIQGRELPGDFVQHVAKYSF